MQIYGFESLEVPIEGSNDKVVALLVDHYNSIIILKFHCMHVLGQKNSIIIPTYVIFVTSNGIL